MLSFAGSDALLMDVTKSSDPTYNIGVRSIPRRMLTQIEVTERKGWIPWVTAGAVSAAAFAAVDPIGRFEDKPNSDAKVTAGVAITIPGGLIGGYILGRKINKKTRVLTIAE